MKLLMVSLGCDKNLVDSEEMLGILTSRGFEITDDETEAEAAVINTCCFIEDAKKESIEEILSLAELKKTAKLKVLVVTGCMAQRYREEILEEIPEVDAIVGTTGKAGIADAMEEAFRGRKTILLMDASRDENIETKRIISTGGHYAFLKLAEGCDKHCTYCIIPKIRGKYRSFPMEKLLSEARDLADAGVTELILVAQETTIYGVDLYGRKVLHELLGELCRIDGLHWIRILYCYPEEIYPELIEVMAREKKICHYLDLPIQHASDAVLKRMNRRTSEADLRKLVSDLREKIPDIFLRTTLISGFPGETEEDHQVLKEFVREMKFDRLGVFTYSREEDTPAAKMKDQVPQRTKEKRRREIMQIQQKISLARGKARIGKTMEAVIEGELPEEGIYAARTYGDAPGVDGMVFIPATEDHMSGDFVNVRITGASEYDLTGDFENEFTE
ncbi:MAG TPA: 30S ribosomal protein S12 methylthiotransferase RimO [Lachnospiraceae bacterium]|nr:30S ribosomal protein S12 methylthiotransferase RimO [Lachnospiraceae bacterium]